MEAVPQPTTRGQCGSKFNTAEPEVFLISPERKTGGSSETLHHAPLGAFCCPWWDCIYCNTAYRRVLSGRAGIWLIHVCVLVLYITWILKKFSKRLKMSTVLITHSCNQVWGYWNIFKTDSRSNTFTHSQLLFSPVFYPVTNKFLPQEVGVKGNQTGCCDMIRACLSGHFLPPSQLW